MGRRLGVVLLSWLMLSGTARAYVLASARASGPPLRWGGTNCVRVRPAITAFNHVKDGTDGEALEQATRNWVEPTRRCSYIEFVLEEPAVLLEAKDNGYKLRDGVGIFWVDQSWTESPGFPTAAVAVTTIRYISQPGDSKDGEILDADLHINGENYIFTVAGAAGTLNVMQTLTHELGHVLGLDHPCTDVPVVMQLGEPVPSCSSADFTDEVMFPSAAFGDSRPHKPTADELEAVCSLYPLTDAPAACASVQESSGCGAAPNRAGLPGALLGLLPLALLALLLLVARRA